MTLLITIGPSLALMLYFILSDKFKEPKKIIIITFLFGVLITIPAGYLNYFIDKHFENESVINNALLHGFFSGGLVEETLKFLVLYFYVLKEKEFNEPMDAIVYGVVISLGFATLENIEYVYFSKYVALDTAIIRAYSAVPMHCLCAVVMGYYFGSYVFSGEGKYMGLALIVPIVFHGTYNFLCAFSNNYFLFVVFILLIFSILLHRNAKVRQRGKRTEREEKKV